MYRGYLTWAKRCCAAKAKLKPEELPLDGFEYLITKRTDMIKLMEEHQGSFHRSYVLSWRKQNLEVSQAQVCTLFCSNDWRVERFNGPYPNVGI